VVQIILEYDEMTVWRELWGLQQKSDSGWVGVQSLCEKMQSEGLFHTRADGMYTGILALRNAISRHVIMKRKIRGKWYVQAVDPKDHGLYTLSASANITDTSCS